MMSANNKNSFESDSMNIKEHLAKIQARLRKLQNGMERYNTFEEDNIFRSRNTAHFASDEEDDSNVYLQDEQEEKSFQQLNSTQIDALMHSTHEFKKVKPLFQVQERGIKANIRVLSKPSSKSPINQPRISQSESTDYDLPEQLSVTKNKHYHTICQEDEQTLRKPPRHNLRIPQKKVIMIKQIAITPTYSNSRSGSVIRCSPIKYKPF